MPAAKHVPIKLLAPSRDALPRSSAAEQRPMQRWTQPASQPEADLYRNSMRMMLESATNPSVPPVSLHRLQRPEKQVGSGQGRHGRAELPGDAAPLPSPQQPRSAGGHRRSCSMPAWRAGVCSRKGAGGHLKGVDSASTGAYQNMKAPSSAASRRGVDSASRRSRVQALPSPAPAVGQVGKRGALTTSP